MIDAERLIQEYKEARDEEIDRLLSQYGSSLKDIRQLYPQLTEAIEKQQTAGLLGRDMFFTAAELSQMGMQMAEGWMLKATPTETGLRTSFITPEKWEISDTGLYRSPTGEEYTRQQLEALLTATAPSLAEYGFVEQGPTIQDIFGVIFPEQSLEEVIAYAEADFEGFLSDIIEVGRTPETETLLRALGADEAHIEEFFGFSARSQELKQTLVDALKPVTEKNVETMWQYFMDNPQNLRACLIGEGRNPTTEKLVRLLFPGVTDYQMEDYFNISMLTVEAMAAEAPGGKWGTFTAGVGDLVANTGGVFKWLGAGGVGEKIVTFAQYMQVQAEPVPFEADAFTWKQVWNPQFYATYGIRMLPTLMVLAIPGIAAYGLAAAPAAAITAKLGITSTIMLKTITAGLAGAMAAPIQRSVESALEAGGAYDQALAQGLTPEEAEEVANRVFHDNMKLVGLDAVQIAIAFMPDPFSKAATSAVARGLVKVGTIGGKLVFEGLTEGGEEFYQEMQIKRAFGDERGFLEMMKDPDMQLVFSLGAIAGLGMGGGFDLIARVQNRTIQQLTLEQRGQFDTFKAKFVADGLAESVATMKALDSLVQQYPDLGKKIEDITKRLEKEVTFEQLKPKDEATRIAVDRARVEQLGEDFQVSLASTMGRIQDTNPDYTVPVGGDVGLGIRDPSTVQPAGQVTDEDFRIPSTDELVKGLIVPNWINTAIKETARVPVFKKIYETVLGWRSLVKRESQAVQDIVGRGAVVYGAISRMGQNYAKIEIGALKSIIANPVKAFGFNEVGYSSKMAGRLLAEHADQRAIAGTLEHVFTQPEMYDWTGMAAHLRYVARVNQINHAISQLLGREGLGIEGVSERWIHRVVTGKTVEGEVVTGRGGRGGKRPGAKPSYMKPRTFKTMAEGIAALIQYDPNIETSVGSYIEEAFKAMAGERFTKMVEEFGTTPTERLMERYPEIARRAELTKTELADAAKLQSLVNRARRGEKLPEQTLRAIERRFPELGHRLRSLVAAPFSVEKQLRQLLKQNERYIAGLKADLERARAVPPVTPREAITPEAEVKVVHVTEIEQHVETKYGRIPEDTEFLSNWRGLDTLDAEEGAPTPADLDTYLSKLKPERAKQEIETIEVAIGDQMGDLIETYRYESVDEGQALEQYLDSLLQVTHKYRQKLGMAILVDFSISALEGEVAARPERVEPVPVPDEQKLAQAFKLMEYEDRLAFRSTMETQLQEIGMMGAEYGQELAGLEEWLSTDPVATYTAKEVSYTTKKGKRIVRKYDLTSVLVGGRMPETLTPAKARYLLMGRELKPGAFDKQGQVRWEYIIDELAETLHMGEQDLVNKIERLADMKERAGDLKTLLEDAKNRQGQIERMLGILENVEGQPASVKVEEPHIAAPEVPYEVPETLLQRFPPAIRDKVKEVRFVSWKDGASFNHKTGVLSLVRGEALPRQIAHEMAHIHFREPGVREAYEEHMKGVIHPERFEEIYAAATEEYFTGMPIDVFRFPREAVDKALDFIRKEAWVSPFPEVWAPEVPTVRTSRAEQFTEGLRAGSIFEGGEVRPDVGYAWRSMGEAEYKRVMAQGAKASEAKRGAYWSWFPEYSSRLEGKAGKPKYLVEVKARTEGEGLAHDITPTDISGVWRSEGKGWVRVPPPEVRAPEVPYGAPAVVETGQPYSATVFRGYKPEGLPTDEGLYGKGTYYTTNREYAETYDGKEIQTVTLKNPYVIKSEAEAEAFWNETTRTAREEAIRQGKTPKEADEDAAIAARQWLEERGHDGLIARDIIASGDEIVVFYPETALGIRMPTAEGQKIPQAAPGMPEAGLQVDMFGYTVPVEPKGKGKPTQISMDDYKKLVQTYEEQGLPMPYTEVKPKIEGISELSGDTEVRLAGFTVPPEADRKAQFDSLAGEVKALVEGRKAPYWQARAARARAMEIVRQAGIGEAYLPMPFAGGKIYDQDFVDSCNRFFGHEEGLGVLKFTSDLAGILRITKAALDFSAMMIQGLPAFGLAHGYLVRNPAIGAKLVGAWYRALAQSAASAFHGGVFYGYLAKNEQAALQRVSFGGSSRAIDYFETLKGKHGLAKIAAWTLQKIPLNPFERAELAFFSAGEIVRNEFWKALSPKAIKQGKAFELARSLDLMTGLADAQGAGVPLTMRQLESSFLWFAPNYTRACLTFLSDVFRGGYTGAFARQSLGGMLAAGVAYYVGIQIAMTLLGGGDIDDAMDKIKEGLCIEEDPITGEVTWRPHAGFMGIKVGNYTFGPGSFWYGLVRLVGNIGDCINEVGGKERIDLVRILQNGAPNRDNPFIYWWYSRASPLVGTGFELATGKDFLGYPIETPRDYLVYILTRFEPIWMEQGLNWMIPGLTREYEIPEGAARLVVPLFEIFGWRSLPESTWVKFYDQAQDYIKQLPREELDEKQIGAWESGKLGWGELTAKQKQDLLDRYPALAELYEDAQNDSKMRQTPEWKAYTDRLDEERAIYYDRIDELTRRLQSGEIDTRTYRELAAEAGQNYGAIMEGMQRDPTYKAIYDYFDKKQAEGSKYEFMWDIALAEYNTRIRFSDDPEMYTANGDFNWDERDRRIDSFIEKWGEDLYRDIMDFIAKGKEGKGLNQLWVLRGQHVDKLGRTYWRLPYKPLDEMDQSDYEQGNIPAEHYALWRQYQGLPDVEREAFLEAHPELTKDWRAEYRKNNPEIDAMLALWGYSGKIQSMEAYNQLVQWSQDLGIPLAQMGLGLPPQTLIEPYFDYADLVTKYSPLSAEVKLWRLENEAFQQWAHDNWGWEGTEDYKDADYYRLQIKWRPEQAEYDAFGDKKSPQYIDNDDRRDKARADYLDAHPEFRDDRNRMKAMDIEFPEDLIEDWVGWYAESRSGYEDDWWLMEHRDFYDKMMELEIWTKPRDFTKVPTREVWGKYQVYQSLPLGNARLDYRAKNLDLDAWLVLAKGLKPVESRGDKEAEKTVWEEAGEAERFKSLFP